MMHAMMMRPWFIPSSFPHTFSSQTPASSSSWVSSLQFIHYCMHTPRRRDKDSSCNEKSKLLRPDPIPSQRRTSPPPPPQSSCRCYYERRLEIRHFSTVFIARKTHCYTKTASATSASAYHRRPRCLTPCPTLLRNSCCPGATRSCARSIDRARSLSLSLLSLVSLSSSQAKPVSLFFG